MLTWPVLRNHFGYDLCFYTVHDPVADARNKMAVRINSHIVLKCILARVDRLETETFLLDLKSHL